MVEFILGRILYGNCCSWKKLSKSVSVRWRPSDRSKSPYHLSNCRKYRLGKGLTDGPNDVILISSMRLERLPSAARDYPTKLRSLNNQPSFSLFICGPRCSPPGFKCQWVLLAACQASVSWTTLFSWPILECTLPFRMKPKGFINSFGNATSVYCQVK